MHPHASLHSKSSSFSGCWLRCHRLGRLPQTLTSGATWVSTTLHETFYIHRAEQRPGTKLAQNRCLSNKVINGRCGGEPTIQHFHPLNMCLIHNSPRLSKVPQTLMGDQAHSFCFLCNHILGKPTLYTIDWSKPASALPWQTCPERDKRHEMALAGIHQRP